MIARILVTSRFPRAAIVVEILAIAELCRATATNLEALAEHADNCEPSSLRRLSHGIVRELVAEVGAAVAL